MSLTTSLNIERVKFIKFETLNILIKFQLIQF